ncbi:MAG: PepSY domain-containing protein [Candidatus Woesearchaeota archaeon]
MSAPSHHPHPFFTPSSFSDLKQLLQRIETKKPVEDFLYTDEQAYLSHVFKLFDEPNKDEWQVGYYSPADGFLHVFIYDEALDTIIKNPGDEAFKEPDAILLPLLKESLVLSLDQAKAIAYQKLEQDYHESIKTALVVVQHLQELGVIYNFTFITSSYKTINIKIDAQTGAIASAARYSIFDLGKSE